jgi:hypothetical protein
VRQHVESLKENHEDIEALGLLIQEFKAIAAKEISEINDLQELFDILGDL